MHDAPSAASLLAMVKLGAKVNALERCRILAEAKIAYECLHPETRNGGDRRKLKGQHRPGPPAFVDYAASLTGLSPRTIRRAASIWPRLTSDTRDRLNGHRLSGNQSVIRALAELDPVQQHAAVDGLLVLGAAPAPAKAKGAGNGRT